MGIWWVAVSALCVAVLVLGWLVRECRLENERLREDLEREASSLQAKVLGILGAPKVDIDEYKDTTHVQGLWQAGIEERLSDLNLRVARNTAALDALPNAADIIAAVTGPFVELARPRPYQFQPTTDQATEVADVDAWDTYDPTDDEFPIRDPGDYTPPAAFGGLPGL